MVVEVDAGLHRSVNVLPPSVTSGSADEVIGLSLSGRAR
jgi:hypothetical protein